MALKMRTEEGWIDSKFYNEIVSKEDDPYDDVNIPPQLLNHEEAPSSRKSCDPREKLTLFEKARVVGTRACQIANNHPIKLEREEYEGIIDPVIIADRELHAGLLDGVLWIT